MDHVIRNAVDGTGATIEGCLTCHILHSRPFGPCVLLADPTPETVVNYARWVRGYLTSDAPIPTRRAHVAMVGARVRAASAAGLARQAGWLQYSARVVGMAVDRLGEYRAECRMAARVAATG